MKKTSLAKKLFISTCMAAKATNAAAKFTGVNYFLPQLFAMRFANMGGIRPDVFKEQLNGLRSFNDVEWCAYWDSFAQEEDSLVKAITYYSVSAWPGITPLQLQSYKKAQELTEQWLQITNPNIAKVRLTIAGEDVAGYMYLPEKDGKYPMIIVTNGLEGTVQELAFPMMKYCDDKTGVFFMEMPGTYAYRQKLSVASQAVYDGVIDYVANQPKVDSSRIAMIGASFGGYWSARMAAVNPLLRCAVTSGPPVEYAFQISNSIGLPAIMVSTMQYVTGAKGLADLLARLKPLSFANGDLYKNIKIPLLIINGDNDTLVGTKDSLELNRKIPGSFLKLYENDDHCAMGHYEEWIDLAFKWIHMQFSAEETL